MTTQPPSDPPRIAVPPADAARALGVTERYLRALRAKGEGPPYSRFGRAIRYPISGLHDFVKAQQATPRR